MTWHRKMGHLQYQNILKLPKVADRINVNRPIPGKICSDYIKCPHQKKPCYKPMSQPTKYFNYLYCNLGCLYPII